MNVNEITSLPSISHLLESQDSQGIVLTDKELRITFWNQWMEMHSGFSNDSVLGRNLLDVFPNFSENQIYEKYKKALDGEAVTLSQQFHNPLFPFDAVAGNNGKPIQQSARIVPIQNGNNVQGTITLIEDVTDRLLREKELERQVAELEALQEVTEALLSKPLEQCLQMIVDKSSRLLNIPNVALVVCDDVKWEIIATSSRYELPDNFSLNSEDTIIDKVIASKGHIVCSDITKSVNHSLTTLFQSTQSFIAVPFSAENKVIGVLIAESPKKDSIQPFCKQLLTRFAGLAASAIWNSSLQKARHEKEQHLYVALESADIGEWSLDVDSSVMKGSSVCKAILGLPTDSTEITAREFLQMVHREDRVKVQRAFTNALEDEQDLHVGFRVVWNDDSVHWIAASGRCLYDEEGNQMRIVGVMRDYTYRKLDEDKLRTKEQQLQIALEAANLGLWQKDLQKGEIDGSPIYKALFDYPPDRIITTEEVNNRTHPEDLERMYRLRTEAFDKRVNFHAEYRVIWDDGSTHWVSTSAHCIHDEYGNPAQYVGVSQDITERKKIENELKRLALVAQETQNAVHITDSEDKIVWVNKGFTKMFGYTFEEAFGKKPVELLRGPLSNLETSEEIAQTLNDRAHGSFEVYNYAKDGRGFWINLSVTPLIKEDNSLEGFVGIISDLTERKQIEVELAQARDAALESAKLKSQFLANMSHEIRTPMNGVIGMTELLLETDLNEEQRGYADTVRTSAETLLKIINDILDFSKIEAGKLDIEKIDFDLRDIVEEVIGMFSKKASQRGIALALAIEQNVPAILKGDPHRLKQVLGNLISNSLKFTSEGYVLLKVKTESNHKGTRLRFTLTDTGIGISDDAQRQIFQPFTQADGSMTRKYGGTGLGLSICRQLVELMNGEIGVESGEGKGSTFWFTLGFESNFADLSQKISIYPQLKNKKALIVGDGNIHQYLLMQQLDASDILYRVAGNQTDAEGYLAMNDKYAFDFLIFTSPKSTDYIEKIVNTFQSTRKSQHTPLILCESESEIKQLESLADSKNCQIFSTPVRQSDLLKALTVTCSEHKNISNKASLVSGKEVLLMPETQKNFERKMKVLVVEDTPTNQQVAGSMLRRLGCDVDIADNGQVALTVIEKNRYDIVFMDCQMPVIDGYEATKELRNREGSQRHSTVIAMTAHAMTGDREKCLKAGMDDYISKPIRQQDLINIIEKWGKKEMYQEVQAEITIQTEEILSSQSTIDLASPFAMEIFERLDDLSFALDAEDILDIIDQLISIAPTQLSELKNAISSKDSQEVRGVAHSLKGSISNMGSNHLAKYCADIEQMGRDNSLDGVEEIFSLLEEKWHDMAKVLLAYKDKLSQQPLF